MNYSEINHYDKDTLMAIPVVVFSREGYKIRKVNCIQMKLPNFDEVMERYRKVPIFDFHSQFST